MLENSLRMAKIALELDHHIYKFPILTFLAKLTSFSILGEGYSGWVAWTIWSDACLLDQITYVILLQQADEVYKECKTLPPQCAVG